MPQTKIENMKTGILWWRNDLRLADHEPLHRALNECECIVPVYVIDRDLMETSAYGSAKIGARRMQFILESLADLKASLRKIGGDLIVEYGDIPEILRQIATRYEAADIYAHKEVTEEEILQEEKVAAIPGVKLHLWQGATLFHPDDIPFEISKIPDVFTQFRKRCEKYTEIRTEIPRPEQIRIPSELVTKPIPSLSDLRMQPAPISEKAAIQFMGGETEAWNRLREYFWDTHQLESYKFTRNGLLGKDYSSKFSAWLAQGCISPRSIYHEVQRYESEVKKNVSTYWLVFELIWRDYFRFVAMKYGNRLFFPGGIRSEEVDWKVDERLDAWKEAKTGIPFVDANMRELNETGFMSNRGRQNVASFLVKDLEQDWRYGAAYFEQELIDYDVTSNWGNWAYVAGVGNDPRENRYFNVYSQASRYDTKGEFVKHWFPELDHLSSNVHNPWLDDQFQKEFPESVFANPLFVPERWGL
jgi:deoxyribodipyrimidine photo-lyase